MVESSLYRLLSHEDANLNLILTSGFRAVITYGLRRVTNPINAIICEGSDLKRPDCYVMSPRHVVNSSS